jgi:hypothetical protein
LNLVSGCDVNADLGGIVLLHVCIDLFDNLSPSLYANVTPEQLCPPSLVASGSNQDVTPLPNGCPRAGAVGVCTTVPKGVPNGYQIRLDSYFYDEDAFEAQIDTEDQECRALP